MIKKNLSTISAIAMLVGAGAQTAAAQPQPDQGRYAQSQYQGQYQDRGRAAQTDAAYRAGYRAGYQAGRVRGRYDDRPPQSGYGQTDNYVQPNTGSGGDPNARWQRRYGQTYSYNDDRYYQQCRTAPDPGGVIAGALIGGLLGNALGHGSARTGTTIAGVIVGGAMGVALTNHLDCEDRSYAYKTYYNGFNSGRPNSNWQWDNPNNGHYGDFRVGDYYTDPDGFRCATYTQQVYIEGEPQVASGHACQQPDGTWAVVS